MIFQPSRAELVISLVSLLSRAGAAISLLRTIAVISLLSRARDGDFPAEQGRVGDFPAEQNRR